MAHLLLSLLAAPGSVDTLITDVLQNAAADREYLLDRALIQCDVLVQAEIGDTGWDVAARTLPTGWAVRPRSELERLAATKRRDVAFVNIQDLTLTASVAMVTLGVDFTPARTCGCAVKDWYVRGLDGHWTLKERSHKKCLACAYDDNAGRCDVIPPAERVEHR
jgi:hypothetical protein